MTSSDLCALNCGCACSRPPSTWSACTRKTSGTCTAPCLRVCYTRTGGSAWACGAASPDHARIVDGGPPRLSGAACWGSGQPPEQPRPPCWLLQASEPVGRGTPRCVWCCVGCGALPRTSLSLEPQAVVHRERGVCGVLSLTVAVVRCVEDPEVRSTATSRASLTLCLVPRATPGRWMGSCPTLSPALPWRRCFERMTACSCWPKEAPRTTPGPSPWWCDAVVMSVTTVGVVRLRSVCVA